MAEQGFKKADEGVADAAATTAKDLTQDATRQSPPDKLFAAADRDVDLDRITPQDYVWRTNDRPLVRVDDQDPADVFDRGFRPKDVKGDYDLNNKVIENNPGPFVSTSYANDFGDNFPYRYDIEAPGGIDFNASSSVRANEGEEEVAFPGGIASQFIKGAQ